MSTEQKPECPDGWDIPLDAARAIREEEEIRVQMAALRAALTERVRVSEQSHLAELIALRARLVEVEAELAACREQNDDYRKHIIPESNRILARVRAEAVREAVNGLPTSCRFTDGECVTIGGELLYRRELLAALLPHDPEAKDV